MGQQYTLIGEELLRHDAPTHEWSTVLPVGSWLKEVTIMLNTIEASDNATAMWVVLAINNDMDVSLNTSTGIQDIVEDLEVTEGGFAYHLADEEIVYVIPLADDIDSLTRSLNKLSQGYKAGSELVVSLQIFSALGTAWSGGTTGEINAIVTLELEVA